MQRTFLDTKSFPYNTPTTRVISKLLLEIYATQIKQSDFFYVLREVGRGGQDKGGWREYLVLFTFTFLEPFIIATMTLSEGVKWMLATRQDREQELRQQNLVLGRRINLKFLKFKPSEINLEPNHLYIKTEPVKYIWLGSARAARMFRCDTKILIDIALCKWSLIVLRWLY